VRERRAQARSPNRMARGVGPPRPGLGTALMQVHVFCLYLVKYNIRILLCLHVEPCALEMSRLTSPVIFICFQTYYFMLYLYNNIKCLIANICIFNHIIFKINTYPRIRLMFKTSFVVYNFVIQDYSVYVPIK